MKSNEDEPADAAALRRRAEKRLSEKRTSRRSEAGDQAAEDAVRLVHELEVHQIELEMQNEELRQARARAEALVTQYTDLYDFAPVGYLTLDREGAIRRVNLNGARLLGAERSRLVNRHFGLLVAEGDRRTFSDFLTRAFANPAKEHCEVTVPQEGQPLVLQIDGTRSADGQECLAVVLNLTERRQAEADLRLQIAALNAAADAVVITDRKGSIEWINAAFTTLTGYGAEEALGRNPRDLVKSGAHSRAFFENLWQTILGGDVWRGEMTNRRKDGSQYPEEQTITPLRDARGEITHFIAIKRDLTERRQLEAKALEAQRIDAVGRLAGGIAHDLNNLLTVINGTSDLASADLKPGDPLRADLEDIHRAGTRAASLTQRLLAFSRRQFLTLEILNLNTVVAGVQDVLMRVIGEDLHVVVVPAADLGRVRADVRQIEQVILNLALNARDAMPTGGTLTIETRNVDLDKAFAAAHPSVEPGPCVMLAISDTGVGMDEATRRLAFEPFFTTKPPVTGSGLGLSAVYGIVKQTGGSIWIDSAPGAGTTVSIYLPRLHEVAAT